MSCWDQIRSLEGRTLRTLDQGNLFDVVSVTDRVVIVSPHVSGNPRAMERERIESAFQELVACGEISRATIRAKYSQFNPAYVAALLAELAGVTHVIRPIRLRYNPPKRVRMDG